METFLLYNRWLHIAASLLGFFVAPAALYIRKGGAAHRRWGQVFFWVMLVAGSTALAAAVLKGLALLLLLGIFSLYLAFFGFHSLHLKHLGQGQHPSLLDWYVGKYRAACVPRYAGVRHEVGHGTVVVD